MALTPSDVGIILSYRCQATCRHCFLNCGPDRQESMSPELLREALRILANWPQPVHVHFTGGEPFLDFELLLEAVRQATALGIPHYVETNAGWCVTEELVTRRLTALREAGLRALMISCSPFHAEMIPPARVRLALSKAREILGPERGMLDKPEWLARLEQFNGARLIPLERYIETLGTEQAGRLFWQGYGLIPAGRAGYRLGRLAARHPANAFLGRMCRTDILYAHHSHFDPCGNYIPGACSGLALGDWHDLPQRRSDFSSVCLPPLIDLLVRAGPFALFEMAGRQYGYQPLPEGYVDKCHLCVDVRRTLVQRDEFPELEPQAFYTAF